MLALEGSQAIARTVSLCRPGVVAAYPITPQTHIVERLADLVAEDKLKAEYVSAESEFSAASIVLGAAAAGVRVFTATSSQGLLLMAEVLYNIAGLRVPVVMVCANRALSAPISIWNDHEDAMAVRDCGWVMLFCASNQEAVDTLPQAYRLAENLEIPVMVCVDGYTLTHTLEPLELPSQEMVDAFLPPYRFSRPLDPARPLSLGMLAGPEVYTEVKADHHQAMEGALGAIDEADRAWMEQTGRASGGLVERIGPPDARVGVLTLGSVWGTFLDAREELGLSDIALLRLRAFRPFPAESLCQAVAGLENLLVVERAFSRGVGGVVAAEVRQALYGKPGAPRVHATAVGLGGRDVPLSALDDLLKKMQQGEFASFKLWGVKP